MPQKVAKWRLTAANGTTAVAVEHWLCHQQCVANDKCILYMRGFCFNGEIPPKLPPFLWRDCTHLPGEFLSLWFQHPFAKEGTKSGSRGHLRLKSYQLELEYIFKENVKILDWNLTGALAHAPPVAAISICGGGVPIADP